MSEKDSKFIKAYQSLRKGLVEKEISIFKF